MKMVIQRVNHAECKVDGKVTGAIGKGFCVFLGVGHGDNEEIADKYVKKLVGMRIFEDSEGKTNLDLSQVDGEVLVISQFTLYANCKKGNRPSFVEARIRESVPKVETGVFAADMKISLENDGPFTVILEGLE